MAQICSSYVTLNTEKNTFWNGEVIGTILCRWDSRHWQLLLVIKSRRYFFSIYNELVIVNCLKTVSFSKSYKIFIL